MPYDAPLQPYDPSAFSPLLQVAALRGNPAQVFTGGGLAAAPGYNSPGGATTPAAVPGVGRAAGITPQASMLAQMLSGSSKTALAAAQLGQDQQQLAQIQQQGSDPQHATWGSFAANMLADVLAKGNLKRDQEAYLTSALADRANAAQRAQDAADAAAGNTPAPATAAAVAAATNSDASVEDDVRAAVAQAKAGQAAPATTSTPGAEGLPIDGRTSASGGPLMVGDPAPNSSVGVSASAQQAAAPGASGGLGDPNDPSSIAHLVAALQNPGSAAPQGDANARALAAGLRAQGAPPQANTGSTSAPAQPTAWGLDPTSSGQMAQGGGSQAAAGAPRGQAAPMQLAAAQGPPQLAYGPQSGTASPPAAGGAGSATISPAQQAFGFFTSRGYSPAAAAGLVGNLQAESGLNSGAYNAGEGAGGIAQWRGARLDGLKAFAAANGSTPDSFTTQLAYMDHELRTSEGHAGALLQNASDPMSAAAAATAYFRPAGYAPGGDPSAVAGWQTRSGAAQAAMQAFGGQQTPQAQQQAMLAARGLPPGSVQLAQNGMSDAPVYGGGQAAQVQGLGAPPAVMYGPAENARERAVIGALIGSPDPGQRAQAMQMLQTIQERELNPIKEDAHYDASTNMTTYTPVTAGEGRVVTVDGSGNVAPWRAPLDKGFAYDANGVAHPIAGTTYTDVAGAPPGAILQRGPDGKIAATSIPNASGGAPSGTVWNGQSYAPAPGASYGPPQQLSGTNEIVQRAPDGSIKSVGFAQLTPKDLQSIQSGYASTPEAKDYQEALAARRAMGVAAQQSNGAGDYAMLDTYARAINPGAVARLGTIGAIKESRDVPAQVQAEIQHWGPNGGTLSPASRQQLLNTTDAFVDSRWQALQPRLQDAYGFAQRNGVDPRAVIPSFDPPTTMGGGAAGGQQNQSQAIAFARRAVQQGKDPTAIRARLQQMGINPAAAGL